MIFTKNLLYLKVNMKRLLFILSAAAALMISAPAGGQSLLIDKGAFELTLFDADGIPIMVFPVATGLNPGDKKVAGDHKTPEGTFTITSIENKSRVTFDYHDGKGPVFAYGPWFFRLKTGFQGIGIHGTCPERDHLIGTRDSHGCIRLHNEDLLKLYPYVFVGMKVVIVPGIEDLRVDGKLKEEDFLTPYPEGEPVTETAEEQ